MPVRCLASRSGALHELVGGGALLFNEEDETALAKLLAEVMSNPEDFNDVRVRGRAPARGLLSVKRQAEPMGVVFDRLRGRRAIAPAVSR